VQPGQNATSAQNMAILPKRPAGNQQEKPRRAVQPSRIVSPRRRDSKGEITSIDVLSGRGGCSNTHAGNRLYREIVRVNQATYKDISPPAKHLLALSIIEAIRRKGGRFMCRDGANKQWMELHAKEARNKVAQALRGEVYLKNPQHGDWYAKKRPQIGERQRPKAGEKGTGEKGPDTSVSKKVASALILVHAVQNGPMPPPKKQAPPARKQAPRGQQTGFVSSSPQSSLAVNGELHMQTLGQQNLYASLSALSSMEAFASASGVSPHVYQALRNMSVQPPKTDQALRNVSAQPPTTDIPPEPIHEASENEDGSIFLEALEGMTGMTLRRNNVPSTKTGEQKSSAGGLMSLASLAGSMYAEEEGDSEQQRKQQTQSQETRYPDSAPSSSSDILQQPGSIRTLATNEQPARPAPSNIPQASVVVPAALAAIAPPTIQSGGPLFDCALVQYNALGGQPQQILNGIEHRNWNFSAGLAVPPSTLLFNQALWEAPPQLTIEPNPGPVLTEQRQTPSGLTQSKKRPVQELKLDGDDKGSVKDKPKRRKSAAASMVETSRTEAADQYFSKSIQQDHRFESHETRDLQQRKTSCASRKITEQTGEPPKKRKKPPAKETESLVGPSKKHKHAQGKAAVVNSVKKAPSTQTRDTKDAEAMLDSSKNQQLGRPKVPPVDALKDTPAPALTKTKSSIRRKGSDDRKGGKIPGEKKDIQKRKNSVPSIPSKSVQPRHARSKRDLPKKEPIEALDSETESEDEENLQKKVVRKSYRVARGAG
jgi:hypothetical protein